MATYELIALDEVTPQLLAPTSGDTGLIVGNLTVNGSVNAADIAINTGSITCTGGTIDFGDENLTTTGLISGTYSGVVIGTDVQAWDAQLDDIAAAAIVDGNFLVANGTNWVVESLGTARASLGSSTVGDALFIAASATAAQQAMDTEVGVDIQAYDASLADIAGLTLAQGDIIYHNGTNLVNLGAGTSGYVLQTNGAAANPSWVAIAGALTKATAVQAEAGTDDTAYMTPLKTKNAIDVNVPRNYIDGLIMVNASVDALHDIEAGLGKCVDSTNTVIMENTNATFRKRVDVATGWVEGTGNGGLANAVALGDNQTLHYFIIRKSLTDSQVDFGFDTSLTATNLLTDATGYTYYRRIGSVVTDGSSNILPFTQHGDYFFWDTPVEDVNDTFPGTNAVTETLTVPDGLELMAHVRYGAQHSSTFHAILSSLDGVDETPNGSKHDIHIVAASTTGVVHRYIKTNTTKQIRSRASVGITLTKYGIFTIGWIDSRGKE